MDREILRQLAGQIAEIAALDIQKETAELYRAVNSLRMIRPVVLLDELPWNQLNASGELTLKCQDPYLREIECGMRRTLWRWNHCRGDMLIEPYYGLYRSIRYGDIGVHIQEDLLHNDGDNHIVSHHYIDQLSTMEDLEKHLYSAGIPDPDLIIRTSGEYRISNFLLWQSAYAEYYFTDVYWPDFKKEELYKALSSFENRKRRFGK